MISSLPNHARIWIYQSDKFISTQNVQAILEEGKDFIASWDTHGKGLTSEFEIIDNLFLVFAVDEEKVAASGCSIDKSVHFVKQVEQKYGLNLFNRMVIAYSYNDDIQLANISDIEKLISEATITPDTIVYDNTIQSVGDLFSSWKKSAKDTWLSRYF